MHKINIVRILAVGILALPLLPSSSASAIPLEGNIFEQLPNDPKCRYQLSYERTGDYGTEKQVIESSSVFITLENDGYKSKSIAFAHAPFNIFDVIEETFPNSLSEEEIDLWYAQPIVRQASLSILVAADRDSPQISTRISAIGEELSFGKSYGLNGSSFRFSDLTFECPKDSSEEESNLKTEIEKNTKAIVALRNSLRSITRRLVRMIRHLSI